MRGLYAIVDTKLLASRRTDTLSYARALLDARPAAIQLRAKENSAREILALLRVLRPLCQRAGVVLVANDRADLAALAGCEMVHIGQDDTPYSLVHRIAPQLGIGVSTHTPGQLAEALTSRPRYAAYGPIYETASKLGADPVVGVQGLQVASEIARTAGVPLVAIGGITLARIPELAPYADACAVIADLFLPGATLRDVTDRAILFQRALSASAPVVEASP